MDLVSAELPAKTLVVAIDPGKASHRVLLADGEQGLIGEPVSLPTLREGIERLCELIDSQAAPETLIAIEATGSLHLPWVAELERRLPGSTRLFAPSEIQAARTQLGSRRFKDDDRDCAALVSLARQGRGRPAQSGTLDALLDAVRHRRRLIAQRKVARQHLHHQLNALCPGLSAPAGHGRVLGLETPTGQAVFGLRSRLRRQGARSPLADGKSPRPALTRQRRLLVRALAQLPGAARRRRAARRASGSRREALACLGSRRPRRRGPDLGAVGPDTGAGLDDAAGGRGDAGGGSCGARPADLPLCHC